MGVGLDRDLAFQIIATQQKNSRVWSESRMDSDAEGHSKCRASVLPKQGPACQRGARWISPALEGL